MREPLVRLLDALDAIAADHDEVYDTDVRDRMARFIEHHLIAKNGTPVDEFLGWVD